MKVSLTYLLRANLFYSALFLYFIHFSLHRIYEKIFINVNLAFIDDISQILIFSVFFHKMYLKFPQICFKQESEMYSIIISLVLFNTLHSGAFISFLFSVFITPNFLPFVAVDMVEVDLKLYTLKKFHKRLFDKQLS